MEKQGCRIIASTLKPCPSTTWYTPVWLLNTLEAEPPVSTEPSSQIQRVFRHILQCQHNGKIGPPVCPHSCTIYESSHSEICGSFHANGQRHEWEDKKNQNEEVESKEEEHDDEPRMSVIGPGPSIRKYIRASATTKKDQEEENKSRWKRRAKCVLEDKQSACSRISTVGGKQSHAAKAGQRERG